MIRISWMLVSYLAAAIVIRAGLDQPEQAIDTERSFLTVHVERAGLLSAAAHGVTLKRLLWSVARLSEKLLDTSKKTLHGPLLSQAVRETRQIHPYL